jgi:hypothetical protein
MDLLMPTTIGSAWFLVCQSLYQFSLKAGSATVSHVALYLVSFFSKSI